MRFSPGCCCGDECLICGDTFARADNADVNVDGSCGGWTALAGTFDIASSALHTASTGAILVTTDGVDTGPSVVTVEVAGSDGDLARIILNYVDTSNYDFAEIKFGTGAYYRLYRRASGTNTLKGNLTTTIPADTFVRVRVALSMDSISLFYGATTCALWAGSTPTPSGTPVAGLGSGATAGNVRFKNFEFHNGYSEAQNACPAGCFYCPYCPEGYAPSTWKVVISGYTSNAECEGSDCHTLDGTYYLSPLTECLWYKPRATLVCTDVGGGVGIQIGGGGPIPVLIVSTGFDQWEESPITSCFGEKTINHTLSVTNFCNPPATVTIEGLL